MTKSAPNRSWPKLLIMIAVAWQPPVAALITADHAPLAPEFTHSAQADWVNSKPLILADLRGQVVLVDIWTFECWNCYRSFPWLRATEAKFAPRGLRVVGVHSPEFDREKVRANIEAKVAQFGLHHPIMVDTDFSYWHALGNRYWPAYYLFDKQGRVRAVYAGETHADDAQADAIARDIEALLAEAPSR